MERTVAGEHSWGVTLDFVYQVEDGRYSAGPGVWCERRVVDI
jgi:hypothetical protein